LPRIAVNCKWGRSKMKHLPRWAGWPAARRYSRWLYGIVWHVCKIRSNKHKNNYMYFWYLLIERVLVDFCWEQPLSGSATLAEWVAASIHRTVLLIPCMHTSNISHAVIWLMHMKIIHDYMYVLKTCFVCLYLVGFNFSRLGLLGLSTLDNHTRTIGCNQVAWNPASPFDGRGHQPVDQPLGWWQMGMSENGIYPQL